MAMAARAGGTENEERREVCVGKSKKEERKNLNHED
jgi:hypothetical protein